MTRIRCPHCHEVFEFAVGHVCGGQRKEVLEAELRGWDRKTYMKSYMREWRRRKAEAKEQGR